MRPTKRQRPDARNPATWHAEAGTYTEDEKEEVRYRKSRYTVEKEEEKQFKSKEDSALVLGIPGAPGKEAETIVQAHDKVRQKLIRVIRGSHD